MRRVLSIAMMFVLLLPFAAPALGQTVAATPICCRMAGVHKCLLHSSETDSTPKLRALCPSQSQQAAPGHATGFRIGSEAPGTAALAISAMRVRQAEAGFRIAHSRSRQKRGPPAVRTS